MATSPFGGYQSPFTSGVGNFLGGPQNQGWSPSAIEGMGPQNFGSIRPPSNLAPGGMYNAGLTPYQRYFYGEPNPYAGNFSGGGSSSGGGGGASAPAPKPYPGPPGISPITVKSGIPNPEDFNVLPDSVVQTGLNQLNSNIQKDIAPQQYMEAASATPGNLASARSGQNIGGIQEARAHGLQEIAHNNAQIPLDADLFRHEFGTKVLGAQGREALDLAGIKAQSMRDALARWYQGLNQKAAFAALLS